MLAYHLKRGVETTLERVYKNTGNQFKKLSFQWNGKTAGVIHTHWETKVILPSIDETKEVGQSLFNNLIGYALHELGHVWFTKTDSWDAARKEYGTYVGALINGLEDPRIERCVTGSGYAPNASALFENLVNSILSKDGLPKPDDFQNYPFMLAIEGRRLNGYSICLPSVIDQSPHAVHLRWALDKAHAATDTAAIVSIAIELYKRLQQDKQQDKQDGKPEQGDDQGDQQDDQQQDGDQQGDQQQDGQGSEQSDEQGDSKPKKIAHTGRGVEPDDFISDELKELECDADAQYERVIPNKPVFQTIELY
jgi:hypothetical protein